MAGLLAILGLGLSTKALTWVLAAWIIVRVGFEVWCAIVAPLTRIRVLFALSAIVDLVLVAFLVTHTTGSVSDLALVGGSIVALWGMITLVIGMAASKVDLITAAGTAAAPEPLTSKRINDGCGRPSYPAGRPNRPTAAPRSRPRSRSRSPRACGRRGRARSGWTAGRSPSR